MNSLEIVILESCRQANVAKLGDILRACRRAADRDRIARMFDSHMSALAQHCVVEFLRGRIVDENFIKSLHRMHYPEHYKKTIRIDGKNKVVILVPGEYKTIANFPHVAPAEVKGEMRRLVDGYHEEIDKVDDKFYCISRFILDFFRIHPFGNGNGSVASIIYDLLLLKHSLPPVHLKGFYLDTSKKREIYDVIERSIRSGSATPFAELMIRYAQ